MSNYKNYIGIDVAKDKFDVYDDATGEYQTIANKRNDIENFCDQLTNRNIEKENVLVVIDLTGGYEKEIVEVFYAKGFTHIMLAEGLKVKNFSKSTRYNRAKTDKEDCYILAEYGKKFHKDLKLYEPSGEVRETINKIYTRIEDLKDLLQREKNRLKQPNVNRETILKEDITENIEHLEKQIKKLKDYLIKTIQENKKLNIIYNTLINQRGIGEELGLFLLVRIKELGIIERKQLTSICGLAPIPYESGNFNGHRYIRGGRKEIRSKMFLCLMNMSRFDEDTKTKINIFLKRGKSKKVAIIALARKKMIVLNAKVRDALLAENI